MTENGKFMAAPRCTQRYVTGYVREFLAYNKSTRTEGAVNL
jgi:hypothetical protein